MESPHTITNNLRKLINSHAEWLMTRRSGNAFSILRNEIEIETDGRKILLSFLTESGFETWRIVDCEIEREKILLELSRNFAKEVTRIELIPRTLAEEFRNLLELARLERANNISRSIVSQLKNTKPIQGNSLERC